MDINCVHAKNVNRLTTDVGLLCLMRQIMWSLEYLHNNGYTHGDIKGGNIMINNNRQSFLIDYGLSYRYQTEHGHVKHEPVKSKQHNGTIDCFGHQVFYRGFI